MCVCVCVCVKFILLRGWYHGLNGQEFEQTLGDSEVQGSLECCSSWSHRIGHDLVTENNNSISELLELWFVIINFRIFSGKTDAQAEAPIIWPHDVKI